MNRTTMIIIGIVILVIIIILFVAAKAPEKISTDSTNTGGGTNPPNPYSMFPNWFGNVINTVTGSGNNSGSGSNSGSGTGGGTLPSPSGSGLSQNQPNLIQTFTPNGWSEVYFDNGKYNRLPKKGYNKAKNYYEDENGTRYYKSSIFDFIDKSDPLPENLNTRTGKFANITGSPKAWFVDEQSGYNDMVTLLKY